MPRGPKKHLKRLNAPKHWMLDKLGGVFAPKPSPGPHKTRECLPAVLILRNRLKYALTNKEVVSIMMQRLVQIDGKVRTDATYPAGFMDVISIEKTDEHFRLLYDTKGRFVVHRISKEEAAYKLCKVRTDRVGKGGVPFVATHDGRTIRYVDPDVKVHDSVMYDFESGKVKDFIKFEVGNLVMCTGGANCGRVGIVQQREKHKGALDMVHVVDAAGRHFVTRITNVFVIGKGPKPLVSLPKQKGVRKTILEEQDARMLEE